MLANKQSFPSDLCIALMGLEASVILGNASGEKNILLKDFVIFDATGFVLKSVVVPLGLPFMVYKTYKVCDSQV